MSNNSRSSRLHRPHHRRRRVTQLDFDAVHHSVSPDPLGPRPLRRVHLHDSRPAHSHAGGGGVLGYQSELVNQDLRVG